MLFVIEAPYRITFQGELYQLMAYWRNYRKISTEVNEIVDVESSDDEKSNEN